MPAPRAVLTDLAEANMDPCDNHSTIGANGRLKAPAPPAPEKTPVVDMMKEKVVEKLSSTVKVDTSLQTEKKEAPKEQKVFQKSVKKKVSSSLPTKQYVVPETKPVKDPDSNLS